MSFRSFCRGVFQPMPSPLGADERRRPAFKGFPQSPPREVFAYRAPPQPGAQAQSLQSYLYQLSINPLGAGVVVKHPFRAMAMPGTYTKGALVFGIQQINFGRTPEPGGPLWSPSQLALMLGDFATARSLSTSRTGMYLPSNLTQALSAGARAKTIAAAPGPLLPTQYTRG